MNLLYKIESKLKGLIRPTIAFIAWQDVFEWDLQSVRANVKDDLVVRWANADDLKQMGSGHDPILNRRVELGGQAAIAKRDDEIMGVAWVQRERYFDIETGLQIEMDSRQAWLFGAWVHRKARRLGIYSSITGFICGSLVFEYDVNQMLLAVDRSNIVSRSAHQKLGAVRIGQIKGFRLFGRGSFYLTLRGHRQPVSADRPISLARTALAQG